MLYDVTRLLDPVRPLTPLVLSEVRYLIAHHTGCKFLSWPQLNADHKKMGLDPTSSMYGAVCAGYNEYVTKGGDVYILRGDNVGAHCLGYNSNSYGICCEGDYDLEHDMPALQYNALLERVKFHIDRLPKKVIIIPHREFVKTSCPGGHYPITDLLRDAAAKNDDFDKLLEVLASYTTIDGKRMLDPEYWKVHAVPGGVVEGEFARILIERLFEKITV